MNFREWNRRKNNWLRLQKGKWAAALLGKAACSPYTPAQVKRVLVLRNDNKLGDMLVSSVLFRGLRQLFPQAQIDVVAGKVNACLAEQNADIHRVYLASESVWPLLRCGIRLRKKRYDLYLDLDAAPTLSSLVFLKLLAPRWAFGFNRKNYPLYTLTQEVSLTRLHITQWYEQALRQLGFAGTLDCTYQLPLPEIARQRAGAFLEQLPRRGRLIAVSPLGASLHRSFSAEQIEQVARAFPQDNWVLLGQPGRLKEWLADRKIENVFPFYNGADIFPAAAVLQQADILLTVDTFWVHAACALQKNALAVYQKGEDNWTVWRPNYKGVTSLFCSGEQKQMPPQKIIETLQELLDKK